MTKIKYDRARIALEAKRFTYVGVPYSVALKEAWRAEKLRVLKRLLASGVVEFRLREAGKLIRDIAATTVPHLIPINKRQLLPRKVSTTDPYVRIYDTKEDKWTTLNNSTADIEFKGF